MNKTWMICGGALAATLMCLAACGDDDGNLPTETGSNGSGGSGASGGAGGGGATGGGGGESPTPEVIVSFDFNAFELPEGVSADSTGDLYVSMGATGAIMKVTPQGEASQVAQLTLPPPVGSSFLTGITHDDDDMMYVALASSDQLVATTGIYRIGSGGGTAELYATDAALLIPNDFAWDAQGTMFVTDSSGAIFYDNGDGTMTEWLRDPLITGDNTVCPNSADIDFGANGIVIDGDTIYIANTDLGSLVRIPINGDGSAGTPENWLQPDCSRAGLDGIVLAPDGILYGAVNRTNTIITISPEGDVSEYASGGIFDFPASLIVWDGRGENELAITNFALSNLLAMQPGNPAILALALP